MATGGQRRRRRRHHRVGRGNGKMAAVNAALALGTMSDALDWEDCSWTGHPAAGVIPCAWLAAEE